MSNVLSLSLPFVLELFCLVFYLPAICMGALLSGGLLSAICIGALLCGVLSAICIGALLSAICIGALLSGVLSLSAICIGASAGCLVFSLCHLYWSICWMLLND